jgi:secreted PhoX family phosphatase
MMWWSPPEYDRYVLVGWGDRVFPNPDDYFGYNCDYTAFILFDGHREDAGYLWVNHEFVSRHTVDSPESRSNSGLFRRGVLYVARYFPNGSGQWIPLLLSTPVDPVIPSEIGAAELAASGLISRGGNTRLPRRTGVAGQTGDGGSVTVTTVDRHEARAF